MDSSLLLTLAGWLGALGTVSAYALLTFGKLSSTSALFQTLNIAGAALLCVSATVSQAWPSAAVNAVWIVIGLQALMPLLKSLKGRADASATVSADASAALAAFTDATYDARAFDDYAAEERERARTQLPPTLVLPVIRDSGYVLDNDDASSVSYLPDANREPDVTYAREEQYAAA